MPFRVMAMGVSTFGEIVISEVNAVVKIVVMVVVLVCGTLFCFVESKWS